MRIALTGGAGFLGAHCVREAQAQGHSLRLLLRPGGDRRNLEGIEGCEIVEGVLGMTPPLPAAFPGPDVDLVLHLAAVYSEDPATQSLMHAVNVQGTQQVLDAAARDRVPRMVHCSTMGTVATIGR